jgi:AcrR family transcriptional regulator
MTPPRSARREAPTTRRSYGGKTLDARRAEQRERILLAARDVFAARGYAGAGVEEIVARARVSRTTFYVFFDNKEECLLGVFRIGLERLGAVVLQAVADTAAADLDPAERVRAEVGAVAAGLAADPAMARVILIEIVGATPDAEAARDGMRNRAAQIIEDQLAQYPEWRGRSPVERRVASLAAMAAIAEPISDLVASGRIDQWETLVDPISEFVARGLMASRGAS